MDGVDLLFGGAMAMLYNIKQNCSMDEVTHRHNYCIIWPIRSASSTQLVADQLEIQSIVA